MIPGFDYGCWSLRQWCMGEGEELDNMIGIRESESFLFICMYVTYGHMYMREVLETAMGNGFKFGVKMDDFFRGI